MTEFENIPRKQSNELSPLIEALFANYDDPDQASIVWLPNLGEWKGAEATAIRDAVTQADPTKWLRLKGQTRDGVKGDLAWIEPRPDNRANRPTPDSQEFSDAPPADDRHSVGSFEEDELPF